MGGRRSERLGWLLAACVACSACRDSNEPPIKVHLALAEQHLGKGNAEAAVAEFERALAVRENLPALLGLAQLHMAAQRWDAAGRALQRADDAFGNSPRVGLALGDLALAKGDLATARADYGLALDLEKGHVGILLRWAALAEQRDQVRDALARLAAWQPPKGQEVPKEVHLVMAALHGSLGDMRAAQTSRQLAVTATQVGADRAVQVARVYLARRQLAVAEALLQAATRQPYLSPEVWLMLVRVAAELDHADLARSSYASAVVAEKQRPTGALDTPSAKLLAARVDLLAGRHRSAMTTLSGLAGDKRVRGQPLLAQQVRYYTGVAHVHGRDATAATGVLSGLKPGEAHYADAQVLLVQLSLERGDQAGALAQLEALVATEPRLATAYTKLAFMLRDGGKPERAEAVLQGGLRQLPQSVELWLALSQVYQDLNRPTRVLSSLEQAVLHDPGHVTALASLADARWHAGKTGEAAQLYERVVALRPHLVGALNNLAFLYADGGKELTRAHELAARALALAPDKGWVKDTMGWVLFHQGHNEQALHYLEQAVAAAPKDAQARYHLGAACLKGGDRDRGRRELKMALALADDFSGIAQARELLAAP